MAAKKAVEPAAKTAWRLALSRWAYRRSYFPQIGLVRDDLAYETPAVEEALRRLPKPLMDSRVFRIKRAMMLSNRKEVLPKEEWTKFEDDVKYLQPYVDEVQREMDERQAWNKK